MSRPLQYIDLKEGLTINPMFTLIGKADWKLTQENESLIMQSVLMHF
jgi:hypothetical protein